MKSILLGWTPMDNLIYLCLWIIIPLGLMAVATLLYFGARLIAVWIGRKLADLLGGSARF